MDSIDPHMNFVCAASLHAECLGTPFAFIVVHFFVFATVVVSFFTFFVTAARFFGTELDAGEGVFHSGKLGRTISSLMSSAWYPVTHEYDSKLNGSKSTHGVRPSIMHWYNGQGRSSPCCGRVTWYTVRCVSGGVVAYRILGGVTGLLNIPDGEVYWLSALLWGEVLSESQSDVGLLRAGLYLSREATSPTWSLPPLSIVSIHIGVVGVLRVAGAGVRGLSNRRPSETSYVSLGSYEISKYDMFMFGSI